MYGQFFLLLAFACISIQAETVKKFPNGFLFGTGTSAYQIEGAWNEEGKGQNIWDNYTHEYPNQILGGSNADISCDSYHKYNEDVSLLKDLGVNFYRFSISWSRVLPKGFAYKVNPQGIRYYNNLIDLLIKNNITPMVTMFHWDTPQPIDDLGGFSNSLIVNWFEDYARLLFESFGDRVKLWTTFNEPFEICKEGFGLSLNVTGSNLSGVRSYMCGHNVLLAHARVYHTYNNFYKTVQKGKISIGLSSNWYEPATSSDADIQAAQRAVEFTVGWFADPIYHPNGDYPQVMKEFIGNRSKEEGFPHSRLPAFTQQEIDFVKGTFDFFALNHYSTRLAANLEKQPVNNPSFENDYQVNFWYDPKWDGSATEWLKVVPWGFRNLLNWITKRYGNVEIIIAENGFADRGEIDDQGRINYYNRYLSALLDAIHEDKVTVTAYAAWSLLDNFEWKDGYVYKFGLYHVNFSDPARTRTPKSSSRYYKEVIKTRKIIVKGNDANRIIPKTTVLLTFFIIIKSISF